ncbi:hypothetical protein ACKKBG_A28135 [Auxenochlorella protothecoides x Auxenochlorella symbiontica]
MLNPTGRGKVGYRCSLQRNFLSFWLPGPIPGSKRPSSTESFEAGEESGEIWAADWGQRFHDIALIAWSIRQANS